MERSVRETIAWGVFALVTVLGAAKQTRAQGTKVPYPAALSGGCGI